MAKKTWPAYAESRKDSPGVWELVTRDTPDTALNPDRLEFLRDRALEVGLLAEIRPLREGHRAQGLWVAWPTT